MDERLFTRLAALLDTEPVVLASGIPGVRFGYVGETPQGVTVEGIVTAAVGTGGGGGGDAAAPTRARAAPHEDLPPMMENAEGVGRWARAADTARS